jgi:hypothetical protein
MLTMLLLLLPVTSEHSLLHILMCCLQQLVGNQLMLQCSHLILQPGM